MQTLPRFLEREIQMKKYSIRPFAQTALCFGAMFLSACVTQPDQLTVAVANPDSEEIVMSIDDIKSAIGEDNVIILRRFVQPTAWPMQVYINGNKVISLPSNTFTSMTLPEGEHVMKTKWNIIAGTPSETTKFSVKEGIPTVVENMTIGGFYGRPLSKEEQEDSEDDKLIDRENILRHIATCCKYIEADEK